MKAFDVTDENSHDEFLKWMNDNPEQPNKALHPTANSPLVPYIWLPASVSLVVRP